MAHDLKSQLHSQHQELMAVRELVTAHQGETEVRLQQLEERTTTVETEQHELAHQVAALESDLRGLKGTVSAQLTSTTDRVATVEEEVAASGDCIAATEEQVLGEGQQQQLNATPGASLGTGDPGAGGDGGNYPTCSSQLDVATQCLGTPPSSGSTACRETHPSCVGSRWYGFAATG